MSAKQKSIDEVEVEVTVLEKDMMRLINRFERENEGVKVQAIEFTPELSANVFGGSHLKLVVQLVGRADEIQIAMLTRADQLEKQ